MKTGKAAKLFGVDPNTIMDWTSRFPGFFTAESKGEVHSQREYQPEDLIILNTIRVARKQNAPWEKIRADLEAGERETTLPPEAMTLEGESALTLYSELRTTQLELRSTKEENERLRASLSEKDKALMDKSEEVGKWKALAALYEQMWKDEKGSDK
ncbi:MAG: MerR family transcriptional regulator [Anaerolineae bacterium]|nr:MerR family transcriptional regulator [Anaerolineae bacterium]